MFPVRSTKKHRMQNCIRCFLVLILVNQSLVRQYGKAVFLPRGLPLAGNGKAVQQQQRKAEKYGEVASNSMLKGIKNFKKHYNGINVFVDICNVFVYDIDVR